jgi:hypothetical protein
MLRLIVLTASVVYWCGAQEPLRFELKRVERKTTGCVITFDYPEIISSASPQVLDHVNAGTLRVMLRQSNWPAPDSGAAFQKKPHARKLYEHKLVRIFQ